MLAGLAMLAATGMAMADQKDPGLDRLFARLRTVEDPVAARALVQAIWETWLAPADDDAGVLMRRGLQQMGTGEIDAAIETYSQLIELRPEFAEAWNKRATLYWMAGDHVRSVADIRRTVALEPRHFGAWSGLGMILAERDDLAGAVVAYEEVLKHRPGAEGVKGELARLRSKLKARET